jgi:PKD repeat protein/peptidoglycan/xylan/chitin deacetylase (PgdA/CDA1 family)
MTNLPGRGAQLEETGRKRMRKISRGLTALLLLMVFATSSFAAQHEITTFPDNKNGAISLTFDDGCQSHIDIGAPYLTQKGFHGTFFVITDDVYDHESYNYGPVWDDWRAVASAGHEIGSHSLDHPHLTSLSDGDVRYQMEESKALIDSEITSQECLSFAYPFGESDATVQSIADDVYIGSRGTDWDPNYWDDPNYANVNSYSPGSMSELENLTDEAENQGLWIDLHFHTLNQEADGCYLDPGNWSTQDWKDFIDYLYDNKRDTLYIGTFGSVAKYNKEMKDATLSEISYTSIQVVLSLTLNTLDGAKYDFPLTIRSEVPSNWDTVTVQQGGSTIEEVGSTVEGSHTVVYYHAVPDHGNITLLSPDADAPQITALAPTNVLAGSSGFTLQVTGNNFYQGSVVRWDGSDRPTTYVSPTRLDASVTSGLIAAPDTIPVTVFNAYGKLSNAINFEVRAPQPSIAGLSPDWEVAGNPSFTLTVDGSDFISGSKVRWNGSERLTTFVSGTELEAAITAADIAAAGTAVVTVNTPPPGGGTSNGIDFDILPTLVSLSLSPSSVVGGTSTTGTVTLSGTAPPGGAVVSLSSDKPSVASVAGSVTVPGGSSSKTFTVNTSPVSSPTSAEISGEYGSDTRSATLTVNPPAPVADFSGTPTGGSAPLVVTLTDASTGAVTGWSWNFGDTGTSTVQNPSHTYAAAGTYTVSLTVTGPGGPDTNTKTNYITVSMPPGPVDNVTLTADPANSAPAGDNVSLTAVASGGGPTIEYEFQIQPPGGTFATARGYATDPNWTWDTTGLPAGSYNIMVNARNVGASTPEATDTISGYVLTGARLLPIVDFDSDGKTDVAVWRPSNGVWYIIRSSDGGITQTSWGISGDITVPGDYDGDGKTDVAVWRPSNGVWYIIRSSDGGITQTSWGISGDITVPGN